MKPEHVLRCSEALVASKGSTSVAWENSNEGVKDVRFDWALVSNDVKLSDSHVEIYSTVMPYYGALNKETVALSASKATLRERPQPQFPQ